MNESERLEEGIIELLDILDEILNIFVSKEKESYVIQLRVSGGSYIDLEKIKQLENLFNPTKTTVFYDETEPCIVFEMTKEVGD